MTASPEDSTCDVSIIVPVLDEEESVPLLAGEVTAAFDGGPWSWECLWVDDGSTDGTLGQLRALNRDDPRHRYVVHDRNHGQSAALLTGFARSRGRILATLDGDLQNDPADLPRLIRKLESEEVDMVNGVRANRRDSWLRRVSSRIANGFRNKVSGATATDVGCSVRAFYRECAEGLPRFHGMHRFLPTLLVLRGWRLTEVDVNHRPRELGTTSYGVHNRLWVGIADTLGVRWLSSRSVDPRVAEASDDSAATAEPARGAAVAASRMESDSNDG
jgi:glycosyltransferase involved in cell wall biosynthesis